MSYRSVIIIGAPRSGTNMLRDLLTDFPGVATWPCDEINYIWRHGNLRYPSDEFPAELATEPVRHYIRRRFAWVAERYRAQVVVEKSCANSLRVPFVDRVVPEARYIFIRRHGLDVVASAMKRWQAELDIAYLARKARFVPPGDLPFHACRYLGNRFHRLLSRDGQLSSWGPRLAGMEKIVADNPLEVVCALQWRRCVEAAREAFAVMAPERWLEVGYEDLVSSPAEQLARLLEFLEIDGSGRDLQRTVAGVRAESVGGGRRGLSSEIRLALAPLLGETMAGLGYGGE